MGIDIESLEEDSQYMQHIRVKSLPLFFLDHACWASFKPSCIVDSGQEAWANALPDCLLVWVPLQLSQV